MTKEQILDAFKKLIPLEKMEICLMLQIYLCEETNLHNTDRIFYDELKETLRRLRNE